MQNVFIFLFRCVGGNIVLLIQAFRKKFIIPEFDEFTQKIDEIYNTVQNQNDGKVGVSHVFVKYPLEMENDFNECINVKFWVKTDTAPY